MRSIVFVVPGRLDTRTGGTIYDRCMADGLRRLGWPVDVRELNGSFPRPTSASLEEASRVLAAIPGRTPVIVDGLALGAMPDVVTREATRLRIVALVHLPLAADVGIDPGLAAGIEEAERRALNAASLVIVTGTAARDLLARYDLAAGRTVTVQPGTDPAPLASGSGATSVGLLCVATVHAGKGHATLLDALSRVPQRNWHLVCAGSLTRDPVTAERVRAMASRLGLDDRVSFPGDLDRPALAACYDRADLFVLATCQETYGMAVAEALARGLPVVATRTGAIPDLVGDDAGMVVPVGDTAALAGAISRVLDDEALRARLAAGARRVRNRLPTWDDAAAQLAAALAAFDDQ